MANHSTNPPQKLIDNEQAKAIFERLQAGEFDNEPEKKARATRALKAHVARIKQIREAPQEEFVPIEIDNAFERAGKAAGTAVIGFADLAKTMVVGAASEPFVGLRGLYTLATTGDIGEATHSIDEARDAIPGLQPFSEGGERALKAIAAPIEKLDNAARDISNFVSFGNPIAATAIYTTLLGGSQARALGGARKLRITPKMRQMQKIADDLGLDVTQKGLTESILDAAARMTPTTRNANASALREALFKAKQMREQSLAQTQAHARDGRAFLYSGDVKTFANGKIASLRAQGFELNQMPKVQKFVRDLQRIDVKDPAFTRARVDRAKVVDLENINTVRNQISQVLDSRAKVKNHTGRVFRENKALAQLKNGIDDFIEGSMIKDTIAGDVRAVRRWKEFYGEQARFTKDFDADATILRMMDMEATPAQVNQWLQGASAVGARKQAGGTVTRIRRILGDDHPAVEGMRQDFLHTVAEPLIREVPNVKQFLTNFDKLVRGNEALVSAMGLQTSNLTLLRNAARVAVNLPKPGIINKLFGTWETTASRFFVGHQIARAGVRVSVTQGILRTLFGKSQVQQKRLLSDLANAQFDGPFIGRSSEAAAFLITGDFLKSRAVVANLTQATILADVRSIEEERARREREKLEQ